MSMMSFWCFYRKLGTYFTPFSSVSIVILNKSMLAEYNFPNRSSMIVIEIFVLIPILTNAQILFLLKSPENKEFSGVFRG